MDIIQTFYDSLASSYDKLFLDWNKETQEQALILDKLFKSFGFDKNANILDCACGIGTQSVGLSLLGYKMSASDISESELKESKERAKNNGADISFTRADFRALSDSFNEKFDIIICMDNALPHMLTETDLIKTINSIAQQTKENGIFIASIRDYDNLVKEKPPYSPPYIHKTDKGQRVSFQTWNWTDIGYKLTQYIIDDEEELQISKFDCEYRTVLRDELGLLLTSNGFKEAIWKFPEETGFYQPIVIAIK